MNLTPADKALAAGFAGQLEPAKKRQFVVTVIRGGHRHEWTEGYTSQQAAQDMLKIRAYLPTICERQRVVHERRRL